MIDDVRRIREACEAVPPLDVEAAAAAQQALDDKTKPRGSLGRLEALAVWFAAARGEARPARPRPVSVVCAGDHGVAAGGVSAYPPEVTAQMVANFAAGGAAINVLARAAGAELVVVDVAVSGPRPPAPVLDHRIRGGTRDLRTESAMTVDETRAALVVGLDLAADIERRGLTLVGLGEMGIGNSTAASALTAAYCERDPAAVTGRGTGVDDAGHGRKLAAVREGLARCRPDAADPLRTLAELGGFEIAALAGLTIGCAARRIPVITDGFIATAAALAAARLCPAVQPWLLAAHRSVEPGHAVQLADLGLRPLLDLDMRLGEGTGAALAFPIVDAAVRVLHDMASFGEAGVSTEAVS